MYGHHVSHKMHHDRHIGMIVAQACAASATQMSLSAFHSVGTNTSAKIGASNTYGNYLRMSGGVDYTYVVPSNDTNVNDIVRMLSYVSLKDVISVMSVRLSSYLKRYNKYFPDDICSMVNSSRLCLSIKLDMSIMYRYRINMMSVKSAIERSVSDTYVVPSPYRDGTIEIFYKDKNKNPIELTYGLVSIDCSPHKLTDIQIHGVNGLKYSHTDNGIIVCTGHNISALRQFNGIDHTKTYTNNIMEMYRTYGIIATRTAMTRYLTSLLGSSRALDILISNMTVYGYPIDVTHNSCNVNGHNRSVLYKMCYEHTMRYLKHALDQPEQDSSDVYDRIATGCL